MLTIGLLGGVASGKSTVAKLLAERGAAVLDADRAAHDALADQAVLAAIRERWGDTCFDSDGQLIRRCIAERVFGPAEGQTVERKFLESLVHPHVRRQLKKELAELRSAGQAVAVLDIPLLLEAGWDAECDLLVLVDSPQTERLARAVDRGWDLDELARRESAQAPISEKRERADTVIHNDGTPEGLRSAVDEFCCRRIEGGSEGRPRLASP